MRLLLTTLFVLSCTVAPTNACHTYSIPDTDELTEGPYWIDPMLNRADITEGQAGLPFIFTMQVIDKSLLGAACAATSDGADSDAPVLNGMGAMNNVQVDIWHASAAGSYSGFSQEGTAGLTWLRGYQRTNNTGQVTFHTIFPGYYTSRTTHIHARIRVYDSNQNQVYDDTTQIFFDDTFSDSVYAAASATYLHGTRTTYNTNDNIYTSDMKMSVTDDVNNGYNGNFILYYPFGNTPTTTTTTATPTTTTPTTATPTTATPTTMVIPTTATPTTSDNTTTTAAPTTTAPTTSNTTTTTAPNTTDVPTSTPTTSISAPVDVSSSSTAVNSNSAAQWIMSPYTWMMSTVGALAAFML